MENVFILGGCRSHIGVKDKQFRNVPAETLGASVLREVVSRYCPEPAKIDMILGGNAVGGGGNITRLAALSAGIPESVPCATLDLQCASSLEAVTAAAAKIESGLADLVIAGGLESASTQPLRIRSENHPDGADRTPYTTAQFVPGRSGEKVMLEGAEAAAVFSHVTREEADPFVLASHRKAAEARASGILEDILVSVAGSTEDEGIRPRMSQRLLDRMPLLLKDGVFLTAGNSCLMHDGAAFVVLCSRRYAEENGLTPSFLFRHSAAAGGDPFMSPCTAVLAAEKLLSRTGLTADDISAFEVNEAFAVIDVLFHRAFPGIGDRYSIFGGALAYGHPYGASGALLLLHLMKALSVKKGTLGLASAAAAGGIGEAVLIERI